LIARQLGRSASTISREVSRNGGSDRYRASRSDQAASIAASCAFL
jgi:IS30 family transposase